MPLSSLFSKWFNINTMQKRICWNDTRGSKMLSGMGCWLESSMMLLAKSIVFNRPMISVSQIWDGLAWGKRGFPDGFQTVPRFRSDSKWSGLEANYLLVLVLTYYN